MTKPVYLLAIMKSMKEPWYHLTKVEQDKLWAKVVEADHAAGAKFVLACNTRWADESVYDFAIIEYPDMDSYLQKVEKLEELDWWRYASTQTILGTKMDIGPMEAEQTQPSAGISKPVYMLVRGEGWTEAWYQLSKEEHDSLWAKVVQVDQENSAKWVIGCYSRWADESIYDWGVIQYPDMDCYQQKVEALEKLEWFRYFKTKTILGTKMEMA
jgi:hypothetical protein